MIKAGQQRKYIQLQARDAGQDSCGQPPTTWTTYAWTWASVISPTGNESFRGMQFAPEVTHLCILRWGDDTQNLNPAINRIITPEGWILDIQHVNFGPRRIDPIMVTCLQRLTQTGSLDVG